MTNKELFSCMFKNKINKDENYKKIINEISFIDKNMNKTRYLIFPVAITISILLLFVTIMINNKDSSNYSGEFYNGLPIQYKDPSYAYDVSSPNKAAGMSRYVFIAKIDSILRTDYLNPTQIKSGLFSTKTIYDPYTVYSINVLKNIKGELITTEPIEMMQAGGIDKNGESYIFIAGSESLKINEYYIILTGAFENGGILEVTNPDRIVLLGKIEPNILQNILDGNITDAMRNDKTINEVVEKIEKYVLATRNEEKPSAIPDGYIPILDNISKYDIHYNK